jgi:hypothetical protein
VRGSSEIAGNFAFLSDLNGGSELWKGEQGANRLATMNAGLAATTGLSSSSDILAFQGAKKLLAQWSPEDWNERIGNLDNSEDGSVELRRGYDYIDAMAILERGLTPDLFHSQMKRFEEVENGSRTGIVEQMRNVYGLNYLGSAALYQAYGDKKTEIRKANSALSEPELAKKIDEYFSGDAWKKTIESYKDNPEFMSKELEQLSVIKDIQKYISDTGQRHFDARMKELETALVEAWKDAKPNTRDPAPGQHAPPTAQHHPFPPAPEPVTELPPIYITTHRTLKGRSVSGTPEPEDLEARADEIEESGTPYSNLVAQQTRLGADRLRAYQEKELKDIVDGMLKKDLLWNKDKITFFTGNGNLFTAGADENANKKVKSIFDLALKSKVPEEREAAIKFAETAGKVDKGLIKAYNENDKWNELGNATNIHEMLNTLQRLINSANDAADRFDKTSVEIQGN